jgi:tetrahydromethanopterin S-methyltransferase subunit D
MLKGSSTFVFKLFINACLSDGNIRRLKGFHEPLFHHNLPINQLVNDILSVAIYFILIILVKYNIFYYKVPI